MHHQIYYPLQQSLTVSPPEAMRVLPLLNFTSTLALSVTLLGDFLQQKHPTVPTTCTQLTLWHSLSACCKDHVPSQDLSVPSSFLCYICLWNSPSLLPYRQPGIHWSCGAKEIEINENIIFILVYIDFCKHIPCQSLPLLLALYWSLFSLTEPKSGCWPVPSRTQYIGCLASSI